MADLDSLINSLSSQLEQTTKGSPSARGLCWKCKRDILGKMVNAMDHEFHIECWVCEKCKTHLETDFYPHDGFIYCEWCHIKEFCPVCHKCGQAITDEFVQDNAPNKYHKKCFSCMHCNAEFPNQVYYPKKGGIYCGNCVNKV